MSYGDLRNLDPEYIAYAQHQKYYGSQKVKTCKNCRHSALPKTYTCPFIEICIRSPEYQSKDYWEKK